MKVLFVTSECAPYSKSGGLADVAFSLPPALKQAGQQVEIITPLYKCVKNRFADQLTFMSSGTMGVGSTEKYYGLFRGELSGVPIWFIDNEEFFNRDKLYGYDDDKLRFAWFSKAVVELMDKLDFFPDIMHCNDWESALSVIYLKDAQLSREKFQNVKSVFTIHNIAYQGQFGEQDLTTTFGLHSGWYEGGLGYFYQGRRDINLMKGAMLMADAVSTVSPTYAMEIHEPKFGRGLENIAYTCDHKLYGILNGIDMDHYDPMKDKRIACPFDVDTVIENKAVCKERLQHLFEMNVDPSWPVLCSVARLVEQKGIELIKEVLPGLMDMGCQVIIFGQGEQRYIDYFNECKKKWPEQFGFSSNYSEETAAEVFAGCDFYLMPSNFEPCGLSQMMAMRYGTIPIVYETGGLKDSVRPYSDFDGIGDGFSFDRYDSKHLYLTIMEAIKVWFADKENFRAIRRRCMKKDFSWDKSARKYIKMYSDICGVKADTRISFQDAYDVLKVVYEDIYKENKKHNPEIFKEGFFLSIQIAIEGPGAGTFRMFYTNNEFIIEPYSYMNADTKIASTFDNLYYIATGRLNFDKLFINGQLKLKGSFSKGLTVKRMISVE